MQALVCSEYLLGGLSMTLCYLWLTGILKYWRLSSDRNWRVRKGIGNCIKILDSATHLEAEASEAKNGKGTDGGVSGHLR